MQKASKDMDKLGIEILSCNIQNVTDDSSFQFSQGGSFISNKPGAA